MTPACMPSKRAKRKWKLPSFRECIFLWNHFTTKMLQRSKKGKKKVSQGDLRVYFFLMKEKLNINQVPSGNYGDDKVMTKVEV